MLVVPSESKRELETKAEVRRSQVPEEEVMDTSEFKVGDSVVRNRTVTCPGWYPLKGAMYTIKRVRPGSFELMEDPIAGDHWDAEFFDRLVDVPKTFVKDDAGKSPLDALALIDDGFGVAMSGGLEFGANFYAWDNWKKPGVTWRRYCGAMVRHAWAFFRGESIDAKTGVHHLALVAVNAMFLFVLERDRLGTDDRFAFLKTQKLTESKP